MKNEVISSEAISRGLRTGFVGQKAFWFEYITSTNDIAKKMAVQKAVEGTVIATGRQTAGKGRLGRVWSSPEGTMALSVILRPENAALNNLIMAASLAVMHTISKIAGIQSQIKWPNDVLINGKKVCGILIENGWKSSNLDYAVIGIGVNVNFNAEDYPEIKDTATSLSWESGKNISVLCMIRQLLEEFERLYLSGNAVFDEWRENLVTLGKEIRVTSGSSINEGIAKDVDRDGSLLLLQVDGKLLKIPAGEVTLR